MPNVPPKQVFVCVAAFLQKNKGITRGRVPSTATVAQPGDYFAWRKRVVSIFFASLGQLRRCVIGRIRRPRSIITPLLFKLSPKVCYVTYFCASCQAANDLDDVGMAQKGGRTPCRHCGHLNVIKLLSRTESNASDQQPASISAPKASTEVALMTLVKEELLRPDVLKPLSIDPTASDVPRPRHRNDTAKTTQPVVVVSTHLGIKLIVAAAMLSACAVGGALYVYHKAGPRPVVRVAP